MSLPKADPIIPAKQSSKLPASEYADIRSRWDTIEADDGVCNRGSHVPTISDEMTLDMSKVTGGYSKEKCDDGR